MGDLKINIIEFFLTYPLYLINDPNHNKTWELYVYDREFLHYALLKIIVDYCPNFILSLFDINKTNAIINYYYLDQTFNFKIEIDNDYYYVELKTWARLTKSQLLKQIEYLSGRNDAYGIYMLFGISNELDPEIELIFNKHNMRLIMEDDILNALQIIKDCDDKIKPIVEAYKTIMTQLKNWDIPGRTPKQNNSL